MLSGGGAREGLLCLHIFSYYNERKGIRTELNRIFHRLNPFRTRNASFTVDLCPVIFDNIVLRKSIANQTFSVACEARERV